MQSSPWVHKKQRWPRYLEETSAGERPFPESEERMRHREGSGERTRPECKRDAEQEVRVVVRESGLVSAAMWVSSGTQKEGCQTGGGNLSSVLWASKRPASSWSDEWHGAFKVYLSQDPGAGDTSAARTPLLRALCEIRNPRRMERARVAVMGMNVVGADIPPFPPLINTVRVRYKEKK